MGREPAEVSAVTPHPHPPVPAVPGVLAVDAGTSATKVALVSAAGAVTRLATVPTALLGADPVRYEPDLPPERWAAAGRVAVATTAPGALDAVRAWAGRHDLPVDVVAAATAPLAVDHRPPSTLGPDRLAGAVAAVARWGAPVVVVDVGTAITCDLVDAGGRFAGGAIAPGPVTGYRALGERVPHLAVPGGVAGGAADRAEVAAAGTSTAEAVRAGVLRGAAGLVDGLVRSHRARAGAPAGAGGRGAGCPVVVTGGLGPLVARWCTTVTAVDPDLTLRGIALATSGRARPGPSPRGAAGSPSPAAS
jgi:type III pantothenate kinase